MNALGENTLGEARREKIKEKREVVCFIYHYTTCNHEHTHFTKVSVLVV